MRWTRRPYAWMVTVAVLAVALAGCVRIDAHLSIAGDTVSGTVILALDEAAARQLDLDPDEAFAEQHAELASLDRVTAARYDDGSWIGREYILDRVLLDDLNRISHDDPDGLRITRDLPAGTYALTMAIDLVFLTDAGQPEAVFADRLDIRIVVTFPGEVVEHNGDLAGSTVTWRPPPGQRTELVAVAYAPDEPAAGAPDDDGKLLAVVLVGGVAAVVLAAAGLGASLLVRRRRAHPALSDTLWDLPVPRPPDDDEPTTQRLFN